ncbi:hypothetical protein BKA63DRAFT_556332 [Paraphoma chrysanthemicola]|nr:hypothetical protein BKA63DRAFT_556332 [Paraphoma chrysanthemicola]
MHAKTLRRIWMEVKEVNADFFNLRTVISPDLVNDDAKRFDFIMSPNDGAMAHLILVGKLHIPARYPVEPPIVQLYTRTQRLNVDAYRHSIGNETPHSSMCFDILRSEAAGGTWKPEYTLSSLFASLMSAIVSFYVTQQHSNTERPEYISMATLRTVKQDAKKVYEEHKDHLPEIPRIPLVEATQVRAKSLFAPQDIEAGSPELLISEPIFLQTGSDEVHSFAIDLSNLHAGVIFSVILSNSTDLVGKKSDTVLVRNGVTATAARKRAGNPTKWFYHGKPMNDGDMRLHVSIGRDQMTFAHYEGKEGKLYVHGDCPVSRLDEKSIGDVKDVPFYVHIYTKVKTGDPDGRQRGPVWIKTLDIEEKGYIHESTGEDERKEDWGFEMVKSEDVVEEEEGEEMNQQDDELANEKVSSSRTIPQYDHCIIHMLPSRACVPYSFRNACITPHHVPNNASHLPSNPTPTLNIQPLPLQAFQIHGRIRRAGDSAALGNTPPPPHWWNKFTKTLLTRSDMN